MSISAQEDTLYDSAHNCFRAQIKSFQVKIRLEGEDEGAKENKTPSSNNNNNSPPANLKSRLGEKNNNTNNKNNVVAKKKETKDIIPPGKVGFI